MTRLTELQELFCINYAKHHNASKAYQQAYGVSADVAKVKASSLRKKAHIKARIAQLQHEQLDDLDISRESIIKRYVDIAFCDVTDYIKKNEDGTLEMRDLSEIDGTLISELYYNPSSKSLRIRPIDRLAALEQLRIMLDEKPSDDDATGVVMMPEVSE